VCGTDKIRNAIEAGESLEIIESSWEKDLSDFLLKRKEFLLY
jgi:uncharacterized protein YbbC (DUF1343 family)